VNRAVLRALLANKIAIAGAAFLLLVILLAVAGPTIAPHSPTATDIPHRLQAPGRHHLFGTDDLGRDVFSRVLVAARVSVKVGLIAVGISLIAGVLIGLVAGYYAGRADEILMRLMDMLFAFPAVLLAIAILAVLGPGVTNAMIAIGVVYTPIFARVTRASVLGVREEVYIRASQAIGTSDARIMATHVLPNVAGPVIVQTSVSLAFAILSEAALSFLGLGVQPPAPSWGRMLYDGRDLLSQAWWLGLFPGLAIFLTVFAFNVLGDGLRDALDPRQRSVVESRGAARIAA
jgi:peptide/nickel transport system permease protein